MTVVSTVTSLTGTESAKLVLKVCIYACKHFIEWLIEWLSKFSLSSQDTTFYFYSTSQYRFKAAAFKKKQENDSVVKICSDFKSPVVYSNFLLLIHPDLVDWINFPSSFSMNAVAPCSFECWKSQCVFKVH